MGCKQSKCVSSAVLNMSNGVEYDSLLKRTKPNKKRTKKLEQSVQNACKTVTDDLHQKKSKRNERRDMINNYGRQLQSLFESLLQPSSYKNFIHDEDESTTPSPPKRINMASAQSPSCSTVTTEQSFDFTSSPTTSSVDSSLSNNKFNFTLDLSSLNSLNGDIVKVFKLLAFYAFDTALSLPEHAIETMTMVESELTSTVHTYVHREHDDLQLDEEVDKELNELLSKSLIEGEDEAITLLENSALFQKVQSVLKSRGYIETRTRSEALTKTESRDDESEVDNDDVKSPKSLLESVDEAILSLGEITGNHAVYLIKSVRKSLNVFVEEYNGLSASTRY